MVSCKFKRVRQNAKIPEYATSGSACVDLTACLAKEFPIFPGETVRIPSGIAIELPSDEYVALIFPRSGLSVKNGLVLANTVGVIDSDYRGEVVMAVKNTGGTTYTVKPGERIAQMCVIPICRAIWEETDSLSDTKRGSGGFGSTGII